MKRNSSTASSQASIWNFLFGFAAAPPGAVQAPAEAPAGWRNLTLALATLGLIAATLVLLALPATQGLAGLLAASLQALGWSLVLGALLLGAGPLLRFRRQPGNLARAAFIVVYLLGTSLVPLAPTPVAHAAPVKLQYVMGVSDPDTRGGMVMDDQYVWISAHNNGLFRATRCTGTPYGDVSGGDAGSWDLWWYNSTGNYPHNPNAGYYIYEAGKNGVVYIFNTSAPASPAGTISVGGVAYGVYATEPAVAKLYVATTVGLKVYNISNPTSPTFIKTISGLSFVNVRGIAGYPYVFATSLSDNKMYAISTATDTIVSSTGLGITTTIRRQWVYQDPSGNYFDYVVDDSGDLWILNVNNPAAPVIVGSWTRPAGTPGPTNLPGGSVYVKQDYAYVLTAQGNDSGSLFLLDVHNPATPVLVDSLYDSAFGFNDIRIDGCEVHIAAHDGWKMYTMTGWQPDAIISNVDGSNYIGQGVYERTPSVQVKSQTISKFQTATYQVQVTNTADRIDRITLSSTLPSTPGWTVQFLQGATDITTQVVNGTFQTPNLAPGASINVTIKVTTGAAASCGNIYPVTLLSASWMCPTGQCSGGVDAVKAITALGCPQMTVVKDDGKTTVFPGESLPYVINYSNTGNAPAANVVITDVLPIGTSYVSANPAAASVTPNTPSAGQTQIVWNIGAVPANSGPYQIKLNAVVDQATAPGSVLTDTVTLAYKDVSGTAFPPVSDDDVDNVIAPPPSPLHKQVDKTQAQPGDRLTYTVTATYTGTELLSNAIVMDPIPAGTTYVPGSANAGGSLVTFTPIAAVDGFDDVNEDGSWTTGITLTATPTSLKLGSVVTVTMRITSSKTITNVTYSLTPNGGSAVCTGPTAAVTVTAGSPANLTFSCTPSDLGEYSFTGDASGAAGYDYIPGDSNSVLVSSGGSSSVVQWNLGSQAAAIPGSASSGGTAGSCTLTAVDDSYIAEKNKTTNYGSTTPMKAKFATGDSKRMLIKFGLTGVGGCAVPTNATITSAKLQLYYDDRKAKTTTISIYQLTQSWVENQVTWNNRQTGTPWTTAGGTYTTTVSNTPSSQQYSTKTWYEFPLNATGRNAIKSWVDSLGATNYGLILLQSNNAETKWRSSESANDPQLVINYISGVGAYATETELEARPHLSSCAPGAGGTCPVQIQVDLIASNDGTTTLNNISPPATLVFTPTSGVTATLSTGPSPAGPVNIISNTSQIFTYMYSVTAGTTPGTIVFGGKPTTTTFAFGQSDSVIVVSPLTFQVTANNPATVNPVLNEGYFRDDGVYPLAVPSNQVQTLLGFSIGDRVWYDANGDGVQGPTESGLPGVVITLTPPITVNLGAGAGVPVTTTTGADGLYGFTSLPAGTYTVSVKTSTLPAGMALTTPNNLIIALTNANRLDADFGADDNGRIGDFVWRDHDGDGVQDGGAETGIPNITVRLYDITGTLVAITTTNASGIYTFTGLPAGNYTVAVDETTLPAGYDNTTPNPLTPVTLTAGQQRTDVDFGFTDFGSIGDRVWEDLDGDGVQDAGEPGLGGVQLILNDTITHYATTQPDGSYLFDNLPSGTYTVTVNPATLPAGYAQTGDPDQPGVQCTLCDGKTTPTLGVGENYTAADFGYRGTGVIGDFVWRDLDGDGVQDGGSETGIPNITVWLYKDVNGNGILDPADTKLYTTTTGINGNYSFANLAPGTYIVDVDQADPDMPLYTNATPDPLAVNLGPGQVYNAADFGFGPYAQLGDFVWKDINGDGLQDPGELGLPGVVVTLTNGINTYTRTTNASGYYLFDLLTPGAYTVTVGTPAGYVLTTANVPLTTTLSVGQYKLDADFGFRGTGAIGDYVWRDENGNGLQDDGATSIPNVTVYLFVDANHNGRNDDGEPFVGTQQTDANGIYTFTNLPADDYVVVVFPTDPALPANYARTTVQPVAVSLPAGGTVLSADFGFGPKGSIGDTVYYDANGNGWQDTGTAEEYGVSNVTLQLWYDQNGNGVIDAGDTLSSTKQTGLFGYYLFSGLPAGQGQDYIVIVTGTLPSGLSVSTLNPYPVPNLAAGQAFDTADFGLRGTSSIGDFVWRDLDGDGLQDGGAETGIAGVTVELWQDTNGNGTLETGPGGDFRLAVTQTNASGLYSFTNLISDTYFVYVDPADPNLPVGYTSTTPDPVKVVISAPNTNRTDVDFGFGAFVSIGDFVWNDLNRNGRQDFGEPGLDGVTVRLYSGTCPGTGPFSTTVTSGGGFYSFANRPAGTYCVDVVEATLPGGFTPTLPNQGFDDTVDSDSVGGAGVQVTYTTSGSDTSVDFGFYQLQPAIVLAKTLLSPASGVARVGDIVTFTIRITNTGETVINSLAVTDTWEPCLALIAANPVTATQGTSQATWNLTGLNLAIGASRLITTGFRALAGDLSCYNYATATGVDVNNRSTGPVYGSDDVVLADPGITVTKTLVSPLSGVAAVSDTITFTIRLTNTGNTAATTLVVTDTYDANYLTLTSWSVTPDANSPGIITWTNSLTPWLPLLPGQAVTLTLDFHADAAGVVTNTATARGQDIFGLPLGPVQARAPVQIPAPVLLIDKDTSTPTVVAGGQVTYTIVVQNNGGSPAYGLTISDTLPTGFTYASTSSVVESNATRTSTSNPNVGDTVPTWGAWTINANGAVTITFVVNVNVSVAPGQYDNTAYAVASNHALIDDEGTVAQDADTPPGQDPEPDEDVTVQNPPGLAVVKTLVAPVSGVAIISDTITFTIRITNTGQTVLTSLVVTDTWDAACMTLTSAEPVTSTQSAGQATWSNLGPLGIGASRVITVDFHADAVSASCVNTATVTGVDQYGQPVGPAQGSDDVEIQARGSSGDFVWWDWNYNGQQDVGEPGIGDVLVNLYNSGGTKIQTSTTDPSGLYQFPNLLPGTYRIEIDPSEFLLGGTLYQWYASPQNASGVPDDKDSDGHPTTHDITTILTSGEVDLTNDFGFDIKSEYIKTKRLNTTEPVAVGSCISFTIRITNTGHSWIGILPLRDVYSTTYMTYGCLGQFASPDSDDPNNDGQIDWSDLTISFGQDLQPGASVAVTVNFRAMADTRLLPGGETVDTATVHDAYADGDGPGPLGPVKPLPPQSGSASVEIIQPTGVALAGLAAVAQPGGVLVSWQTASEAGILGFNLRRSVGGEFVAVNQKFLFAQHAGASLGAAYTYVDAGLPAGVYTYILEVVMLDGRVERHGLVSVSVP